MKWVLYSAITIPFLTGCGTASKRDDKKKEEATECHSKMVCAVPSDGGECLAYTKVNSCSAQNEDKSNDAR